jgi:DNA-binding CsgD family transcriptional regulator
VVYALTDRELEVLWCVAEYGGNQQAADRLGIKVQTVTNTLDSIHRKTGSQSTVQSYHRVYRGPRLITRTTVTETVTYEEIE